eukprot:CAMPEP_0201520340 /NCGR_PEP_ID=MMETSP0161_2-20130828/10653_1 /ASSEMBLY_ACC=CAM_ASM_000251 /TAXON_ID=180227 /ORGANISM="Neoparamoeba aestuarina, Strain SoJaBio B1-5/56/2" /LENGTH=301 /DNA_ID=CAMNT_0047918661 /DNA_START=157 /DNA_END=1062 /DNA_ORIENTATION=+
MGLSASTVSFEMQVVSDVHLEFDGPADIGAPTAPYLALLGDIGVGEKNRFPQLASFLKSCCERYKYVFFLCGNHEFYHTSIADMTQKMLQLEKEVPNLVYLDCGAFDVPDTNVRLLGCTLWSEISEQGTRMLNDFNLVYEFYHNPQTYGQIHQQHVQWLEDECKRACTDGKRVIILTHHGPILEGLVPERMQGGPLLREGCLGSALVPTKFNSEKYPCLEAWCYGHTHLSKRVNVGGVDIISNQMGYPQASHNWGQWVFGKAVPGYAAFDPTYKLQLYETPSPSSSSPSSSSSLSPSSPSE